jgi:hypothetical protein
MDTPPKSLKTFVDVFWYYFEKVNENPILLTWKLIFYADLFYFDDFCYEKYVLEDDISNNTKNY